MCWYFTLFDRTVNLKQVNFDESCVEGNSYLFVPEQRLPRYFVYTTISKTNYWSREIYIRGFHDYTYNANINFSEYVTLNLFLILYIHRVYFTIRKSISTSTIPFCMISECMYVDQQVSNWIDIIYCISEYTRKIISVCMLCNCNSINV